MLPLATIKAGLALMRGKWLWVAVLALTAWGYAERREKIVFRDRWQVVVRDRDAANTALADIVVTAPAKGRAKLDTDTLVKAAGIYRVAQAQAVIRATTDARAVESRYAIIERTHTDALRTQLAAALADAARHDRVRPDAARGGGPAAPARDLPRAADTAVAAADASRTPVVDAAGDTAACATAVVTAQGWQDWWRAVSVTRPAVRP